MASLDELMSRIPVAQVAQRLGVDTATAETAVRAALPTLVGGLDANARNATGAASLLSALGKHSDSSLAEGDVDVDGIDTEDGDRIVSNVFGDNKEQVISTLGSVNGAGGNDLIAKVLPIIAPIVLSYLAKQIGGGAEANSASTSQGGGLADLLGGLLKNAGGGSAPAGGGLGDVLGSVLGGNSGGGLGGLLGGLLGGGKR
ncbi:Bacterial protein of uncharacterised function (DUF937) [Rhodococcus gordoniae]|uniref:Bacterial protein of uncharacterized function (DUF937) n=1 Tax=Rhodococcus gordoniae TaxID=223392 RepID=A0A379M5A3_9NOCA|nr:MULTISPECIES: DUF937 domain-containing protein [Rhodococcus]UTT49287.1 DUF937 domain-containing protein [Rhodococcus gordoniae]SUE16708.1 Bacterial protein of uncharacterised function (DUF937) [Rhodococcus gordoniae]